MKIDKPKYMPLMCWDIYSQYYDRLIKTTRTDFDIKQLEKVLNGHLDKWVVDIITEEDYDALVVTDTQQTIEWVSQGFMEMTGYPKSFSIGKTPHFLQGPKTSLETKRMIKERLKNNNQPFSDSIINYKKNGEEYLCQIKIIPLLDDKSRLSHYLGVEKELKVA